jgi:Arc/MetJ-type ribon-helix-helix transcriptional regulator
MRTILNISLPEALASEVKREVREGKFASTSEFFRHLLRLWNTEKLSRELKKADEDWKNGKKNWKKLNSVRDRNSRHL